MIAEDKINGFRDWLKHHTKLSDKVIRDTTSRLARVEKISQIQVNVTAEDFLFVLGKNKVFCDLSPSVKSQLKKAYTLYHKFHNDA